MIKNLSNFNFARHNFHFICIEHNHSNNRQVIIKLLESQGYRMILSKFSGGDAWFIPSANRGGA